jgi:hypothetical protein
MNYQPSKENLPYPNEAIRLLMDLHKSGRITADEIKVINEVIIRYLDIRSFYLYDE